MKVSVIVPVYNVEKYLKKCIDSLLNQTLDDYEIIIINDCSKQDEKKIIESYNDKRIVYIENTKNMGIGYNRNIGIKMAKGEYVCFIDSDDYVDSNFLSKMYNYSKKNNLDLCVCDYYHVDEKGKIIKQFIIDDFKITDIHNSPNLLCQINMGPCNKIFNKNLLVKNNIYFNEHLKYEDLSFVAITICKSKKIGKVNGALNFFTVHQNSETTTMDKKVFDIFKHLDIIKKYYNNENLSNFFVYILFNYNIRQRYQLNKKTRNEFISSSFKYLKDNNIDYKNCEYIKSRSLIKRCIETNQFITKLYCNIYVEIGKKFNVLFKI